MYSEKTKKNDVGDSDKNTGSQAMQLEWVFFGLNLVY